MKTKTKLSAPDSRIESIAKMRNRIKLSRRDAVSFLRAGLTRWPQKTLIYLDPPYYERGRDLYYNYYKPDDHADLARFVASEMTDRFWIVSYDNVAAIKKLYSDARRVVYNVGYSARESRLGREVMFFSSQLMVPDLVGPVQQVGRIAKAA